jgi:hypothetical protein
LGVETAKTPKQFAHQLRDSDKGGGNGSPDSKGAILAATMGHSIPPFAKPHNNIK